MIETQLAQIVASVPTVESAKILGQLKTPAKNVSMVSTGWGNLSLRAPCTNYASRYNPPKNNFWHGLVAVVQEDPGVPMISYLIYDQYYEHCLCNLGSSMNIMHKVIFEELQYPALSLTYMLVQLVDSSIRYPEGILKNMIV